MGLGHGTSEKHVNTLIVQYCGFKAPWNYHLIPTTLYHDGTTVVHGNIIGLHFVDALIVSTREVNSKPGHHQMDQKKKKNKWITRGG